MLKNYYTGMQINYLKVIKRAPDHIRPSGNKIVRWLLKCICGKKVTKDALDISKCLKTGEGCKSCGCKTKEILSRHNTIHGHTASKFNKTKSSREYYTFKAMHDRCDKETHANYHNYGGRGIKVCNRWKRGHEGFKNFIEDMGLKPKGLSIERIDTNGNYEPSNCRWATSKEQLNNTRLTIIVEYHGLTLPITIWAEDILKCKPDTLRCRSVAGWSDEKIITTPIGKDPPTFYYDPYLVNLRKVIRSYITQITLL